MLPAHLYSEFTYLLIMACSQRKRSEPNLLPAIERYDGVHFRVLRKAQREGYWPANLASSLSAGVTPVTGIGFLLQGRMQLLSRMRPLKPVVLQEQAALLAVRSCPGHSDGASRSPSGGWRPTTWPAARRSCARSRFNSNASTVARPMAVRPIIAIPSLDQIKCSAH